MKYKFSISNSRFCHSEVYDTETGMDSEWLERYDDSELVDKECLVSEIKDRDRHVLFAIINSITHSGDCPPWLLATQDWSNFTVKFEKL